MQKCYMSDTHFVFIGSFFLADAVERVQLHRRIALRLISLLGIKPLWLLWGFCFASFSLSTCLSNTATAIMVTPLAFAVLDHVQSQLASPACMATHARLPQRADDAAAGKAAGEERASAEARDGGAGEGEG